MSIYVFLAKLDALKELYKVVCETYTPEQIAELIDLNVSLIDYLTPKPVTCWGCINDAPDQRSHMDVGGCLANEY